MKKKIFSLLLIFTMFFGFTIINVEAQAEFVEDKFIISNSVNDYNEEDAKELLLFFIDYVETHNIHSDSEGYYNLTNAFYDGLIINFNADLPDLDFQVVFLNGIFEGYDVLGLMAMDYEYNVIFTLGMIKETETVTVLGAEAIYDYQLTITTPEWESKIPEPLTIFGFFNNFYSNYIFPNNILDTQTLNLITAVTTLLFFIGVFRGIWSIFKGRKK